jgi:cytochrome c oxidase assembly protein subunit 15
VSSTTVPSAPTAAATRQRWAPSAPAVRRILLANLVGQVVIVVTGGIVRLTGSGLGCSSWPECEPGQFTPVVHEAASWHPFVEFGNRTIAGILVAIGLVTAWAVWRQRDRSMGFRLLGLVPLLGVLLQAVVGGLSVRMDLNPAIVSSHFLISMVLVGASAVLLQRNGEGDGSPEPLVSPSVRRLGLLLLPLCAVVLMLGVVVTGSGPHSGDEEIGYRFALDPVSVAKTHSAAVWLYVAGVVALVVALRRASAPLRRAGVVLLAVTLLQGVIGYVQYVTGLPAVLVAAHMLGASLLVVAQVRQVLSMRRRPHTGHP